jgi:hypothetical protein
MKEVVPNDLAVDSARDAVLQLEVHLGDSVVGEDGGVRDITYKEQKEPRSASSSFKISGTSDPSALLSRFRPFSSCSRIILSISSQHNSARRIGGSCSFAV